MTTYGQCVSDDELAEEANAAIRDGLQAIMQQIDQLLMILDTDENELHVIHETYAARDHIVDALAVWVALND